MKTTLQKYRNKRRQGGKMQPALYCRAVRIKAKKAVAYSSTLISNANLS